MIIHQLSVFLENKKGRLFEAIETLAKNGINISALSLAEACEYGVVRMIVDDTELSKSVLKDSGVVVSVSKAVAVAMNDSPGGARDILKVLAQADVNIEYMYAFVGKATGKALMVLRTDDIEKTEKILKENGLGEVNPADIYRI